MHRVQLPQRGLLSQGRRSANYKSQRGYWREGVAYEISETQAKQLSDATYELMRLFREAMDFVTSHDEVLQKFSLVPNKAHNQKILQLVRDSWRDEKSRNYVLDRLDIGWDGVQPPKLLERNFGALGLMTGTGPVQEDYIAWLRKKKEYADVRSFGNLESAIKVAFSQVAEAMGLKREAPFSFVSLPKFLVRDRGMRQAQQLFKGWLKESGYHPISVPATNVSFSKKLNTMIAHKEVRFNLHAIANLWRKPRDIEYARQLVFERRVASPIQTLWNYFFYVPELYNYAAAQRPAAELSAPLLTAPLIPHWTLMATSKAMLPILHELYPDHPNLLAASSEKDALKGQKRIRKRTRSYQGLGHEILDENNKRVAKRVDKEKRTRGPYITQAYTDSVCGAHGTYRVFNVFTANGHPAAASVREAPGPFVGGADTKTRLLPIIVRPDEIIASLDRKPEPLDSIYVWVRQVMAISLQRHMRP